MLKTHNHERVAMRLFILLLILVTSNLSAEIFKTLNPDGSTSYSDVETPDSQTIIPPKLVTAPAVKATKKAPPIIDESEKSKPYTSFSISSPKDQSIIIDNKGNVDITLSIEPALQKKLSHSLSILHNGKSVVVEETTLSTQVKDIDRGTHTFIAQILDKDKKVLKTSESVTVHIKRHSILHKRPAQP